MKFFFFLFGAIKFVLAEGGSACGCGRVCVRGDWDPLNTTPLTWVSNCQGESAGCVVWRLETGYRTWAEVGLRGTSPLPTRSRRAFSETASGRQGEECHLGLSCFQGAPSQTGKGVCPPRTGRSRPYLWVRKGHVKFRIIQTPLDFRISGTKPALRNSALLTAS